MYADLCAGYVSGASGIIIGNPFDIIKVRLQAREAAPVVIPSAAPEHKTFSVKRLGSLLRGTAAPILVCGALNALGFFVYNRVLPILDPAITDPTNLCATSLLNIWIAGAISGVATWAVSAPPELIKYRTQLQVRGCHTSSWGVTKQVWKQRGVRGFYFGAEVTCIRDTMASGFYFWSYELSKRVLDVQHGSTVHTVVGILMSGGIAGIVCWASIFPLDILKTRVQTQEKDMEGEGAWDIAKQAYRRGGVGVFFDGIAVCLVRGFIVNAVEWAVYEEAMHVLK